MPLIGKCYFTMYMLIYAGKGFAVDANWLNFLVIYILLCKVWINSVSVENSSRHNTRQSPIVTRQSAHRQSPKKEHVDQYYRYTIGFPEVLSILYCNSTYKQWWGSEKFSPGSGLADKIWFGSDLDLKWKIKYLYIR